MVDGSGKDRCGGYRVCALVMTWRAPSRVSLRTSDGFDQSWWSLLPNAGRFHLGSFGSIRSRTAISSYRCAAGSRRLRAAGLRAAGFRCVAAAVECPSCSERAQARRFRTAPTRWQATQARSGAWGEPAHLSAPMVATEPRQSRRDPWEHTLSGLHHSDREPDCARSGATQTLAVTVASPRDRPSPPTS